MGNKLNLSQLKIISYINNIVTASLIILINSTTISRALGGSLRRDYIIIFDSKLSTRSSYIFRNLLLDSQSIIIYFIYLISLDFYYTIRKLVISTILNFIFIINPKSWKRIIYRGQYDLRSVILFLFKISYNKTILYSFNRFYKIRSL
jgi:hypothetical protein